MLERKIEVTGLALAATWERDGGRRKGRVVVAHARSDYCGGCCGMIHSRVAVRARERKSQARGTLPGWIA